MENIFDKIDRYLDGKMTPDEAIAFEQEIARSEKLKQEVEVQRNLRQGIERLQLKQDISKQFRKMTLRNKIFKWGIATVIVAAVGAVSFFSYQKFSGNHYQLPKLNEEGKAEWSDADRNLPTQVFSIDPAKDTVVETDGGIVFAIPAGAFLNAKAPVTLEVREALNAMDIMKGGLSTMSNGQLLETGGMFYLNARNGEQSLKINPEKPVYANVPANEIKPGMMLFDGERKADGSINWINPKQQEKQLIPVDIFSLDFYPKGYREKIAELGFDATNPDVTDSIYYSYAGRKVQVTVAIGAYMDTIENKHDTSFVDYGPDGAALFKSKCAACHSASNKKVTGPGLMGVWDRVPSRDWAHAWVHDNAAMRASGDAYANKIFKENNGVQMTPFPNLSNDEIDAILDYANAGGVDPQAGQVNPSLIAGIWNEKYQNTLIATKEFEERLQAIFQYPCYNVRNEILNLYINNLDRKMYEIDSMTNTVAGRTDCYTNVFKSFYERHDGGVAIDQSHLKELSSYFTRKQQAVLIAATKTFEERRKNEADEDAAYNDAKTKQSEQDVARHEQNTDKEFEVNLKEAYRQLGIPKFVPPPPGAYYSVNVTTTGWKNIDKYVLEQTEARQTIDYTDPATGKRAVIKYEEWKLNVSDYKNYDQLNVYLVADSLPCFMRIPGENGTYSEKLDELMNYQLVVIAKKGDDWSWCSRDKVAAGSLDVHLEPIDKAELKVKLEHHFTPTSSNDFKQEMEVMQAETRYRVQQQARKKQEEIDNAIMPVIFPGYTFENDTTYSIWGN